MKRIDCDFVNLTRVFSNNGTVNVPGNPADSVLISYGDIESAPLQHEDNDEDLSNPVIFRE